MYVCYEKGDIITLTRSVMTTRPSYGHTLTGFLRKMKNDSALCVKNLVNLWTKICSISSACLIRILTRTLLTLGSINTFSLSFLATVNGFNSTSGELAASISGTLCLSAVCEAKFERERAAVRDDLTHCKYGRRDWDYVSFSQIPAAKTERRTMIRRIPNALALCRRSSRRRNWTLGLYHSMRTNLETRNVRGVVGSLSWAGCFTMYILRVCRSFAWSLILLRLNFGLSVNLAFGEFRISRMMDCWSIQIIPRSRPSQSTISWRQYLVSLRLSNHLRCRSLLT